MFSEIPIDLFKPYSNRDVLLRIVVCFKDWPLIEKFASVRTFIPTPIPEEVGDGGSLTSSGTGARNLYLWEWSKSLDLEEYSEKDLRRMEGLGIKIFSLMDWDLNFRITYHQVFL